MRPEAAKPLWDAREAADRIARFAGTRTFEEYLADDFVRSAVERQFEIIGEALGRLRAVDPEVANGIPQLPRIVAFRNILIHQYADIDHRLVWDIVKTKLPALREALRALLPES